MLSTPIAWVGVLLLCLSAMGCHRSTDETAARSASGGALSPVVTIDEDVQSLRLEGTWRAVQALSRLHEGCMGDADVTPSYRLHVAQEGRFAFRASPVQDPMRDLVLALRRVEDRGADAVMCDDDTHGVDPEIVTKLQEGTYDLWVGAARAEDARGAFVLNIERAAPAHPDGPPPTPIDEGSYGGVEMTKSSGMATLEGRAGGTREASTIGPGCVGYIGMKPDHVLVLREPMHVRLAANSTAGDLVMLIENGFGQTVCNDDADGQNPVIASELEAGTWNVYVGTFVQKEYPAYTLEFSR